MSEAVSIGSLWRRLQSGATTGKLISNTVATAGSFVAKWVFNVVLSKVLTTGAFGVFSILWSLANVLMNTFGFGGNLHLIYGISRDKDSRTVQLLQSLWVTGVGTVLALAIWLGVALIWGDDPAYWWAGIAVAIGAAMAGNILLFSYFKGQGNFKMEATGQLLFLGTTLLACGWLFFGPAELHPASALWAFFAVNVVLLAYSIQQLRKDFRESALTWDRARAKAGFKAYFKDKLPYGLHEMQGALYTHIAILLLGFLVADEDLGTYRSIQLLIVPVSILPSIFSQVALNQLAARRDHVGAFKQLFRKFLVMTSVMGVAILAVYLLLGTTVIGWIYPDKFSDELVWPLLLCFSLTFCFKFISANYGVLITSGGKQHVRVWVTLGSIVVSVGLTLWLAGSHGIVGAAVALAAANLIILLFYAAYGEWAILKRMH